MTTKKKTVAKKPATVEQVLDKVIKKSATDLDFLYELLLKFVENIGGCIGVGEALARLDATVVEAGGDPYLFWVQYDVRVGIRFNQTRYQFPLVNEDTEKHLQYMQRLSKHILIVKGLKERAFTDANESDKKK